MVLGMDRKHILIKGIFRLDTPGDASDTLGNVETPTANPTSRRSLQTTSYIKILDCQGVAGRAIATTSIVIVKDPM